MRAALLTGSVLMGALLSSTDAKLSLSGAPADAPGKEMFEARCAAIGTAMQRAWPEPGTRIVSSTYRPAGITPATPGPPGMAMPAVALPAHCDLIGTMHERTGSDGQHYAIRFHLRLPEEWNNRFFFQGGGGSDGEIGDAIGRLSGNVTPALAQGFAVLSQDAGHDNVTNSIVDRGGPAAFGFDPQARADFGGASLAPVTRAAKAIIAHFYGAAPRFSYFVGCSKGGQEGMVLAQRHPELYDGIVAGAPGFSLPRAALAEAWDTQSFAQVARAKGQQVTPATLAATFSDADLGLVRKAVLDACDADDNLRDGMVGDFRRCTSAKVLPALARSTCSGSKRNSCLSVAQVRALIRVHDGVRTTTGKPLYAGFPWDAGWSDMGWRIWKIGSADGHIPAINILLGAPTLATTFTVPPKAPGPGIDALLAYHLSFDFDRDARAIYATGNGYPRSGWQDVGARSPDLAAFRKRGGRMVVPQGVSDPVFSINDTIAWWNEVNRAAQGRAADYVRVFPVPGMNHCSGGPATDRYDAFAALVDWVEGHKPPASLAATSGPQTPWPERQRPICAYPTYARYRGSGSPDDARSFTCVAPSRKAS